MILSDSAYGICAEWGSREDTPSAIAARYLRTIDALRTLEPSLQGWTWCDAPELLETEAAGGRYPLEAMRPRMTEAVDRNMGSIDHEEPDAEFGWMPMASINPDAPGSIGLFSSAGALPENRPGYETRPFINHVAFDVGLLPPSALLRYPLWRDVLLLLAETWEATFAEAVPGDMDEHRDVGVGSRHFQSCWICTLSPRFAPLVTPPRGIVAERRPDGGLFMAATTEMFRTSDPRHLDAARAIGDALAPMRRLDWPIDEPYR